MAGPAILTEGLTKRFGSLTALDALDLEVGAGEVFGFLGPNGAGKSTTLKLLLGLIRPSAGRAAIAGIDVARPRDAHRRLAYVPGDVSLWPRLTGAECLELFARLQGGTDETYRNLLVERFELDLDKRSRAYSKGNRQKVAIVAAFARRPEVLLLDEPTSGLDPLMEQQFRGVFVPFVAGGQPVAPAALYGIGVVLVTLTFVGVGAVTSQLFGARRRAAGLAGALLGLADVVRMIADGVADLTWLRWLSPLGWVENLQAFAGNDLLALVPLVLAPIALAGAALALDARRDTDDGVVRDAGTARPRTALLRNPLAFAWRQRIGGIVIWSMSLLAFGFVLGAITDAFVDFIAGDAQIAELTAQFGYASLTTPAGFVSSMIALCAAAVAVFAVTGIHRLWEDEQFDRLDLVYAANVSRVSWFGAGLATTAAGALAALAATGIGTWLGCAVTGVDLSFAEAIGASANLVALVALFLGVAVLLHCIAPRLTTVVAGGAGAIYVLSFLAPAIEAPDWVKDLSPWAHVAVAPPHPVNWPATAVMSAIAIVTATVGLIAYARRDLR